MNNTTMISNITSLTDNEVGYWNINSEITLNNQVDGEITQARKNIIDATIEAVNDKSENSRQKDLNPLLPKETQLSGWPC